MFIIFQIKDRKSLLVGDLINGFSAQRETIPTWSNLTQRILLKRPILATLNTCLPTYLPTYIPTYIPTYQPTYLPTYLLPTYLGS